MIPGRATTLIRGLPTSGLVYHKSCPLIIRQHRSERTGPQPRENLEISRRHFSMTRILAEASQRKNIATSPLKSGIQPNPDFKKIMERKARIFCYHPQGAALSPWIKGKIQEQDNSNKRLTDAVEARFKGSGMRVRERHGYDDGCGEGLSYYIFFSLFRSASRSSGVAGK